jgi:hypothetical protein
MSHEGRRGGANIGAAGHTVISSVVAVWRRRAWWRVVRVQLLLLPLWLRLCVCRQMLFGL